MSNKPVYNREYTKKILQGIKDAARELVEKSAANNKTLVIGDAEGGIQIVPAKDLLEQMDKKVN
ncbi:hypothetical protein [Paraflavitalea pollutisoli]|uniref:hypothetical protein n=1 Tax=Paraflavitalea pollutisoli TaxID=3034143 RepID=UPI0023EC7A2B|nr:hypothetical protein [Paraflavitalea sp. H1-2-19X]